MCAASSRRRARDHEQEASSVNPSHPVNPHERHRRPRLLTILAVTAFVLAAPMAALAFDTFADVPTSSTFHDEIDALFGTRIATGCATDPAPMYCPSNPVTRGQMAGFLHRGLGRIGGNTGGENVTPETSPMTIITLPVISGDVPGGVNLVKLDASMEVHPGTGDGCPCRVQLWIEAGEGVQLTSNGRLTQLLEATLEGESENVPLTAVAIVPSGQMVTFEVMAEIFSGTGEMVVSGSLTAVTAPFDSLGNATSIDD
jgi:hypothetical protein